MTSRAAPEFVAPGPGSWEMDDTHVSRPLFGMLETVFPYALSEGMRDGCARYGMLLETLDVKLVHGFPYTQPRVVGAPPGRNPPPRPIFRVVFALLTRLHPELRRRLAIAARLFETRPWRAELARWDAELRAETIAAHGAIAAVDPGSLDDAGLAAHLRAVERHALRIARQDHTLTLATMVPLGDYLVQARDWTGLAPEELVAPLTGFSPISAGDSDERLRLGAALLADPAARALLEGDTPPEELVARLERWDGEVGAATRAFVLVFGNGIAHGLDMTTPTLREQPAVLAGLLREGLRRSKHPDLLRRAEDAGARIRERVPEAQRPAFDALLDEARRLYRLRDERHLYGALPLLGIGRRVMLAAGRRLEARRAIPAAEHALLARLEDLAAALDGSTPLDAAELQRRVELHASLDGSGVPATLGPPPAPPPPPEWLPSEGARRLARAVDLYLVEMRKHGAAPARATAHLEGLAASPGTYEGVARVCETAAELERVVPGDVLVAPFTTPAINHVLAVLGAIVTDRGGALSHAAIVSREYGIPCVVGTREATRRIQDGQRVRVDGTRGTVELLA